MRAYLHRALVAFDVFVNVLAGGLPDETISARVYRVSIAHPGFSWMPGVWLAKAINAGLNVIQHGHGALAAQSDIARADVIAENQDTGK